MTNIVTKKKKTIMLEVPRDTTKLNGTIRYVLRRLGAHNTVGVHQSHRPLQRRTVIYYLIKEKKRWSLRVFEKKKIKIISR